MLLYNMAFSKNASLWPANTSELGNLRFFATSDSHIYLTNDVAWYGHCYAVARWETVRGQRQLYIR